ncbi:MAG: thioredoxin [Candidatus Hydrogenedentota bacterium]
MPKSALPSWARPYRRRYYRMSDAMALTKENFEQTVAEGVTLVDFWAEWCKPCLIVAPTIDELAKQYDGKVKVAKVDVDSQGELAQQFGVSSIPTLLIMKDGVEAKRFVGVTAKDDLAKALDDTL